MRGSGSGCRASTSPAGSGFSSSQNGALRSAGSCASSRCNSVVPLRGSPTTNHGDSIGSARISGRRFHNASSRSRVTRMPSNRLCALMRPAALSIISLSSESHNTASGSRIGSAPKSLSPVCRRALSIRR
jgi:hypothetical protein